MAVQIDTGSIAAKKSVSFKSSPIKSKQVNTPSSPANSPASNGSVTERRAELNRTAKLARYNLAAAYTQPKPTPQERADKIVSSNGGRGRLDTEAVGKELAGIAVADPVEAKAVSVLVLDQIEGRDKDEVAQSFTENLSDKQLTDVAKNARGKELLETFKDHLLSGSVHGDERATAMRLTNAIQGYPTPLLTGNPEIDIKTVAGDLETLAPDQQAAYLDAVLTHPYGVETFQRSALLSGDEQRLLADGLSNAYDADPSGFRAHLKTLVETEKMYPVTQWTGFASVVAMTGNDALISSYADKAIDFAASNPEHNAVSVDAMEALSGMSPQALSNFINFRTVVPPRGGSPSGIGNAIQINSAQFQEVLSDAVNWLDADAYNSGFGNPWAFNPALGNLLNTASKMTMPDGRPSEAAMKIFETVATKTGDNFFTKEAAGAFFVDHAQAVTDRYAALRTASGSTNRNFNPDVLKDFFAGVVYSPVSDLLEYNGKPLTEVIMGDGAGNSGVIGKLAETLMDRSANGGDPEAIGREVGYLVGAVSGGFLDAVKAYKGKFDEDKEFREFMYGVVNKGIAAIGKKAGIPLEKIAGFAEKLYEAGKAKERSLKLRGFQEAFHILRDEMRFALLDFENSYPNALGIEESFTIAWTERLASYLASEWIAE